MTSECSEWVEETVVRGGGHVIAIPPSRCEGVSGDALGRCMSAYSQSVHTCRSEDTRDSLSDVIEARLEREAGERSVTVAGSPLVGRDKRLEDVTLTLRAEKLERTRGRCS